MQLVGTLKTGSTDYVPSKPLFVMKRNQFFFFFSPFFKIQAIIVLRSFLDLLIFVNIALIAFRKYFGVVSRWYFSLRLVANLFLYEESVRSKLRSRFPKFMGLLRGWHSWVSWPVSKVSILNPGHAHTNSHTHTCNNRIKILHTNFQGKKASKIFLLERPKSTSFFTIHNRTSAHDWHVIVLNTRDYL